MIIHTGILSLKLVSAADSRERTLCTGGCFSQRRPVLQLSTSYTPWQGKRHICSFSRGPAAMIAAKLLGMLYGFKPKAVSK